MAQVTIDIPAGVMPRVLDAFAAAYGWAATVPDPADPTGVATIPNPQSKAQFAKACVARYVKEVVAGYEANKDAEAARKAAADKANTDIAIT